MPEIGSRSTEYAAVITFPATKSVGAATIVSSEMYPFENAAYGPAMIHLRSPDKSKIGTSGDTIDVNVYVSFGGGDSWLKVATYLDLRYGATGTVDALYWIPLAPRLKVEAVFAAGDSLIAGHGCVVDVSFRELYSGYKRYLAYDNYKTSARATWVEATRTAGSLYVNYYGDSITCGDSTNKNYFDKVFVWTHSDDKSKITNDWWTEVQFSNDGTNWYFGDSVPTGRLLNGTGISMGAEEVIPSNIPSYLLIDGNQAIRQAKKARVRLWGDSSAALAAAHGIKFFVLGLKQ